MILASLFFGLVVFGLIGTIALTAFYAKDLPSPDKVARREGFATKIYDRNGKLLYDVFEDQRRTPVTLPDIPVQLQKATIAIEDKNFYTHQGFDLLGFGRAMFRIIRTGNLQSGSTLTQQLVKNSLLSNQQTITRKLKEFILTIQVERKYSKDEILQMYLNEVPYGGTAWGVEAAAETYFNKPVSQVNLAEAVILAGLPQSPSRYSPFAGKAYIARAEDVLRRMREEGYISTSEENETKKILPEVQFSTQSGTLTAPHFVFYVKNILEERYGERAVEQGGLRVTTTLDLDLQQIAQTTVSEEIKKVEHLNITNGAAVVADPKTGQILAMVGSKGWEDPNYDGKYNVTTAIRQPGSSIKPIVYLTALRKGYTASTMLMDTKTIFPGGIGQPDYIPENYDGKFRGPVTMRDALGNSLNIPAVKMIAMVGVKDMLEVGFNMGLTTLEPTKEMLSRVGLSMALGGGEVKLLDMTNAYSAFANGGKHVDPIAILKVTDNSGKVLEEWKTPKERQVLTPEEAYIISNILSDPNARKITFGTTSALDIPGKTVAVKTGTTNDKRDNWTIGWTPEAIVGVWVGNNNNSAMKQVASGVTGASPIWRRIIMNALINKTETFSRPEGIMEMDVDAVSGYPAHDGYASRKEIFIKGTEPNIDDPVHKKIKVCKGDGKLATSSDIASGNYDEKEGFYFKEADPISGGGKNTWQEGIDNWLKDQQDPKYHPPTEMCGSSNPLWITILEPGDKNRINSNEVKIKVDVASDSDIKKVEIYVDGNLKETLTSKPWELTTFMDDGKHKVDVKAWDNNNHDGSRFVEFAVNQDW